MKYQQSSATQNLLRVVQINGRMRFPIPSFCLSKIGNRKSYENFVYELLWLMVDKYELGKHNFPHFYLPQHIFNKQCCSFKIKPHSELLAMIEILP